MEFRSGLFRLTPDVVLSHFFLIWVLSFFFFWCFLLFFFCFFFLLVFGLVFPYHQKKNKKNTTRTKIKQNTHVDFLCLVVFVVFCVLVVGAVLCSVVVEKISLTALDEEEKTRKRSKIVGSPPCALLPRFEPKE